MQLQLTATAVAARMMYDLLDLPASEKAAPSPDLVIRSGEMRFENVASHTGRAPLC
jgi:hypothetical protein